MRWGSALAISAQSAPVPTPLEVSMHEREDVASANKELRTA